MNPQTPVRIICLLLIFRCKVYIRSLFIEYFCFLFGSVNAVGLTPLFNLNHIIS